MITQHEIMKALEQDYPDLCERKACRKPGAGFQHSDGTGRKYCYDCARKINSQPGQANLIPIPTIEHLQTVYAHLADTR